MVELVQEMLKITEQGNQGQQLDCQADIEELFDNPGEYYWVIGKNFTQLLSVKSLLYKGTLENESFKKNFRQLDVWYIKVCQLNKKKGVIYGVITPIDNLELYKQVINNEKTSSELEVELVYFDCIFREEREEYRMVHKKEKLSCQEIGEESNLLVATKKFLARKYKKNISYVNILKVS